MGIIRKKVERVVRDGKLLTEENLCREFDRNEEIHKVIDEEDPDLIASKLNEELTNIINTVAPPRVIQVRNNDSPTLSKATKEKWKLTRKGLKKLKHQRREKIGLTTKVTAMKL